MPCVTFFDIKTLLKKIFVLNKTKIIIYLQMHINVSFAHVARWSDRRAECQIQKDIYLLM